MAKKKSQKKFFSSHENPFNIKVNRNKHTVLKQKMRGTRGVPGVSHFLGNAKRKEMFHKKKIHSQKANQFLDKRLMDSSLTSEEQATIRLVQERKKKFKKNIFNLNDDENLTHKGMLIDNNLNDNIVDSDDDEQIDPKFIKQAHFGGFTDNSETIAKSRKEIIDDLIMKSKQRKQEQKIAKEINADLIEKLDKEWKFMHSSIPSVKAGKPKEINVSDKNDPFDVMLKELKFDIRTAPTTRLKTSEELAKEESEKMKKLEDERDKRMMNPMDNNNGLNNHISVESIYDDLDIHFEAISEEENETAPANSEDYISDDDSSSISEDENENKDVEEVSNISNVKIESTSEIPDTIEKFYIIIDNKKEEEIEAVILNILNCNIKNKTKQNLEKLEMFFAVLIEYVMKINNSKQGFNVLDSIIPHLYTLAEISPVNTAQKFLNFLDNEQETFEKSKGKKLKKNFPTFKSLLIFKICSTIYSVSDFKHPVVTPAIIFMCDIISSAYANSFVNIFYRIIICKIMYDCVSYSKRYVPEVLWFLNKTLLLAFDESKKFNLVVDQIAEIEKTVNLYENSGSHCNVSIKVTIIYEVFELLCQYAHIYTHLPSFHEIFYDILNVCQTLPFINYPNFLKEIISKFILTVENVKRVYKPLVFENQKPVPLKLYKPGYNSIYTLKKDDIRKKRKLVKNVEQKIRKEEKGLLREMRRDNQVIASEKLREKLEADEERKRKVKQLYQELAMQEGEYKKFMKKK